MVSVQLVINFFYVINMSLKEVFLWYCKYNNVLPMIISLFYKNNKSYCITSFDTCLKNTALIYGLDNFFIELYYMSKSYYHKGIYGNDFFLNEDFNKAARNWKYFITNNVIVDTVFKEGDDITYMSFLGTPISNCKLVSFSLTKYTAIVKLENGDDVRIVSLNNIVTHNGKPFELKFHIERKGKKYGFNRK